MSVSSELAVKMPEGVVYTSFENDRYILLEISQGNYYELEGTAGYLWSLWRQDGSIARSIEQLASRYHINPSTAETDVMELVADLQQNALITVLEQ